MVPRCRVTVVPDERQELVALTRAVKTSAKGVRDARALLLCDTGPQGPAWTVAGTVAAPGVPTRTIEHLKRRFVERGLEAAPGRKPRTRKPRALVLDGDFAARLTALACVPAPDGRTRWTVRLLARKAVELGLAPRVSPMTVHRMLRKANRVLT